jgi:pimeloyl-ACP methyl ester carboxylesterase
MASNDVSPYEISVSQASLDTLNSKLAVATLPDEVDSAGWDMGVPLADMKRLTKYWINDFKWREVEKKLNSLPNYMTSIAAEGYEMMHIHFLHQASKADNAIPLLFVHGWPGNFLEVTKIIDHLTASVEGQPSFHVVAPSLPNFAFSSGTKKRGFAMEQYAEICHKLMLRLGYDQYVTQGEPQNRRFVGVLLTPHQAATGAGM